MNAAILKHYAGYDLWANHRYIDRLSLENEELLDREAPGSFPSIRSMILHIRNAEHVWLKRLKSEPYTWPSEPSEAIATLIPQCQLLHDHVADLTDDDVMVRVEYSDLKGNEHVQPVWQILMHCFNHSTQHRGQLITMMRHFQMKDIPSNDLIVYQRQLMASL